MTLLAFEQIDEHLETDLTETEITRLLESVDEDIVSVYGAHPDGSAITETRNNIRRVQSIFLAYPYAQSVSSVSEYSYDEGSARAVAVDTDDYEVRNAGRILYRIGARWNYNVLVEYVPNDDVPQRKHIMIDLVKLSIQYTGTKTEAYGAGGSAGGRTEYLPYVDEYNKILHRLRTPSVGLMVA